MTAGQQRAIGACFWTVLPLVQIIFHVQKIILLYLLVLCNQTYKSPTLTQLKVLKYKSSSKEIVMSLLNSNQGINCKKKPITEYTVSNFSLSYLDQSSVKKGLSVIKFMFMRALL